MSAERPWPALGSLFPSRFSARVPRAASESLPRALSGPAPAGTTLGRAPPSAPSAIQAQLCQEQPAIILLTFTGRIGRAEIIVNRAFGDAVKALDGKPFRVLCDFTQTRTMPEDVCAVFVKGQEFAVARGMELDAFVCTSSVLRLQFARISRESGRLDTLGPLCFFDSVAEAHAYLTAPLDAPRAVRRG